MEKCSKIRCFSPEQLNFSAATLAAAISQDLDNDTVSVLGSFFSATGNMLTLTAKQRALIKTCCCPDQSTTNAANAANTTNTAKS